MMGRGFPENFLLQTEPQYHEVLQIEKKRHDFFRQITDAHPDTGGLPGATPSEAVSWGEIDPEMLPIWSQHVLIQQCLCQ
jgi:deoxyhypusine synthase